MPEELPDMSERVESSGGTKVEMNLVSKAETEIGNLPRVRHTLERCNPATGPIYFQAVRYNKNIVPKVNRSNRVQNVKRSNECKLKVENEFANNIISQVKESVCALCYSNSEARVLAEFISSYLETASVHS